MPGTIVRLLAETRVAELAQQSSRSEIFSHLMRGIGRPAMTDEIFKLFPNVN
jgi:hypothetical protein